MKSIGVLTSGGDAPGMNAAVRAVVRTACYYEMPVYGIDCGFEGLIDGKIRALGPRDVSGIIDRGGTILRTARCAAFFETEGRVVAARNLTHAGVDALVVIGGNGSYRGAQLLHAEHGIKCIGLPGTIDNDIGGTDFTIGYATALDTALEAIDRLRDTAHSHNRIFFVELMGRHCGHLAVGAGLAGGAEEILVPERPTDIDALVARLRTGIEHGKRSMIVVVAEGNPGGGAEWVAEQVRAQGGFDDTRVTVLGHVQRGGRPNAFDRLLASRMGVHAVESLREGYTGMMVGIDRGEMVLRPLSAAWERRPAPVDQLLRVAQALSV